MATRSDRKSQFPGVSSDVLALRSELAGGMREIACFDLGERPERMRVSVCAGCDAIWAIVRKVGTQGGLAIRVAHCPSGPTRIRRLRRQPGDTLKIEAGTASGPLTICFGQAATELSTLRIRTELTPSAPLLVKSRKRDLYPLGADDDPMSARGRVAAAQHGLNSGLLYFQLDEPALGTVLYLQNFTALNDYFLATGTTPDSAVGGEWPELGYLPPVPPQTGPTSQDTPPASLLPAWKTVTMADAILVFDDTATRGECGPALRFLRMLGAAYRLIDRPATMYRDWVARAEQALHDLQTAPAATISHDGASPDSGAEYPDRLAQIAVTAALHDYAAWSETTIPFAAELGAGLARCYDSGLGTMRRNLPDPGGDRDQDTIASRHLIQPLLDLGRMALAGDPGAGRLFLGSLDFTIRAGRHFRYVWPVRFKIGDFNIIEQVRTDDGGRQIDVGGSYAYVMLQAYQLTAETRFLDEAQAAVAAAQGSGFEPNRQANPSAWMAAACMRLSRITGDGYYLRESYLYLAAFFHDCAIWESKIGSAARYHNFLSKTWPRANSAMAISEEVSSFVAFENYLMDSGPDLDPAARMLIAEYRKYALDRAWPDYPDLLPDDVSAKESRNAPIAAAFTFAARAFHRVAGAPFRIFCDHVIVHSERTSSHSHDLQLSGSEHSWAALGVIRLERKSLPRITVTTAAGVDIRSRHRSNDRLEYAVPANALVSIRWG